MGRQLGHRVVEPGLASKAASRNEPSIMRPALPGRNAVTPSVRNPNWPTLCLVTRSVYQATARCPAGVL